MPRTLAQNAQYIAKTIKPAIKSAIEAQGVTVPSTDSFLDYADRIGEIEGGGSGYQLKDLPTGSISTVNDAAELPLNALKVSVEAWQEGSGDPSPSNIRPIHGWDSGEISVYKSKNTVSLAQGAFDLYGNDTSESFRCRSDYIAVEQGKSYTFTVESTSEKTAQLYIFWAIDASHQNIMISGSNWTDNEITLMPPQGYNYAKLLYRYSDNSNVSPNSFSDTYAFESLSTHQVNFPTTIYGAEWDVVNGPLDNQWGYLYFDGSENAHWVQNTNRKGFYLPLNEQQYSDNAMKYGSFMDGICNEFKTLYQDNTGDVTGVIFGLSNKFVFFTGISDESGTTTSEFRQWLSTHPLQIKYPLATPQTISQQPLSIRLLEGTNNLYADCGEVIEGEYFVDEGAIDVRKVDYQIGSSGSIKTTDGRVLSGFASMSGYHARPLDASGNWLDVDWSKDFEIGVAFKLTSLPTYQFLFGCGLTTNDRFKQPRLFYDNSTQTVELNISTDGSSWKSITLTNNSIVANKWYFVKIKFTLSTLKLIASISEDLSTFATMCDETLSGAVYHNSASLSIGGDTNNSAMTSDNCLIDTFNTYIKSDGVNWGAFTGVFPS